MDLEIQSSRSRISPWLQLANVRFSFHGQKGATTIMEAQTTTTTRVETRRFRLWFTPVALAFAAAIACAVIRDQFAATDLDDLILGRADTQLTGLVIDKQQRRVICTDKAVLAYLGSSLRNSQSDWLSGGGIFYEFSFRFSTGREYRVEGYVNRTEWSLVVPNANPEEGHGVTHATFLPTPIPNRVREMFEFLNKSYREVSGTVLVLESGQQPRYEYRASLDLEGRRR
jgi:hypothetical protein